MTTEVQDAGTATTDAGGTQTADATQADAAVQASTETTTTAAPADVEYSFEVPEGIELDKASLDEFKTIAKDLKLPADQAKKLHDLAVKREQARLDWFKEQTDGWLKTVTEDKELGNPENLALAKKAIDTFGTPELKKLLENSKMGNHPEVVRLALTIGKAISEDKVIVGRNGGNAPPRDHATILYGTPNT